jgi:hypothetical protein
MSNEPFAQIDPDLLAAVAGGASRSSKGDEQLQLMLTQITNSIKDLASQQNKGTDPMQLMLMMLMLTQGGGGGGMIAAPGAPVMGAPPIINVSAAAGGGCCWRRGKKGW